MNQVLKYLKAHKGYARMKEMKASGIHTREILKAVDAGDIVKVKAGLCIGFHSLSLVSRADS
ncbi:MAG: type IV toxin-antitoxin system AbiEi family antitoxin domain-containing protein [Bacteroidota bacterium]